MFREDLFQEIFNCTIPNTRVDTAEYDFNVFSLILCTEDKFLS